MFAWNADFDDVPAGIFDVNKSTHGNELVCKFWGEWFEERRMEELRDPTFGEVRWGLF